MPSPLPPPSQLNDFLAALSFLSRLGRPCILTAGSLARGVAWHGVVGLLLGLILLGPACLLCLSSPSAPLWCRALLAGWLWLALEVWLTRGLHWDGVADLGDALGSGAVGSKFWQILKDSRLGAFGAMSLLLLLAGQALAAAGHMAIWLEAGALLPLFTLAIAPAWGRLATAWLGYKMQAHAPNSLGAIICGHLTPRILLFACLQAFLLFALICAFAPLNASLLLVAQLILTIWLRRRAKSQNGLSGDFFGLQIETSQLIWLLLTIY